MTPYIAAELPSPETNAQSTPDRRTSDWDIRNAPRNYLVLIVFQAGSAIFSFGAVWLITRNLGSEGYGGIVAIIAASQVAQVLVTWTSFAVVRFGVDEFIETEKIARSFWIGIAVLKLNLLVVALLSIFWFPPLADWLKLSPGSFWLVVVHFCVTAIWVHVQMSLQGAKLPRVQGFLQMVERLVILIGLLILIASANLTAFWTIICYIAGPLAMIVCGLFELRKYINARFSADRVFFRKILRYSLPLLPFSVVGYLSGSYVDAVFLSRFLSTNDLGVYFVATQINGILLQLPTLCNTLLLPLFVTLQRETENPRTFNYFRNVLPSLTLLWGLACTVFAFASCFAVPVVFGSEFAPATVPLWILLAASTIAIPVAIGYSALSNATSTTYISMIAAILAGITNIAANYILIPRMGLAGCAIATLLAFLVSVSVFAILLQRHAKMPVSWSYVAFVPCVAGAGVFLLMKSSMLGLTVCLAASLFIGIWFRASMGTTLSFLRNFRTK